MELPFEMGKLWEEQSWGEKQGISFGCGKLENCGPPWERRLLDMTAVQGRGPGWRLKQGVLGPWMVLKANETHGLFLSVEKRRGPWLIQAPGPEAVAKGFTGHTLSPHLPPHFLALGRTSWNLPLQVIRSSGPGSGLHPLALSNTCPPPSFTYTLLPTIPSIASQQT